MGPTPDETPPKRNGYFCRRCDKILSAWYVKARYCSVTCRTLARRKKVYKCAVCESIWEPQSRETQNKRKTCSNTCRSVLQSWRQTGRRTVMPLIPCPICQKLMSLRNSSGHLRLGCSTRCGTIASYRLNKARKKRNSASSCKP